MCPPQPGFQNTAAMSSYCEQHRLPRSLDLEDLYGSLGLNDRFFLPDPIFLEISFQNWHKSTLLPVYIVGRFITSLTPQNLAPGSHKSGAFFVLLNLSID